MENLKLSKSRHQVSDSNLKLGVQVPIWVSAGFEFQQVRSSPSQCAGCVQAIGAVSFILTDSLTANTGEGPVVLVLEAAWYYIQEHRVGESHTPDFELCLRHLSYDILGMCLNLSELQLGLLSNGDNNRTIAFVMRVERYCI